MKISRKLFWVGNIKLPHSLQDSINRILMLASHMDVVLHRCNRRCNIKCIYMSRLVQMNIAISCQREIWIYTLTLLILRIRINLCQETFTNHIIQAEWEYIKRLQILKKISTKITFLGLNKFKIFLLKSYLIIRNLKNSKSKIITSKSYKNKVHMREEIKVNIMPHTL